MAALADDELQAGIRMRHDGDALLAKLHHGLYGDNALAKLFSHGHERPP